MPNDKLKVVIDTTPLGNANAVRGVGMYTRLLVESLKKFDVDVLSTTEAEEQKIKPDLVHYPFYDLFFSTLPLVHKNKVVVTVHDVIPLIFPEYYKPGTRGMIKYFKQKVALQRVDGVITDSEASKKDIVNYLGVVQEKVHVVPLAANPYLVAQDERSIRRVRRDYKLPLSYILYVGDINYNKNIPQLIKALKFLPRNVKLVCVGKSFYPHEIPEWQWIETQMALSDVADRVKFLTNVNTDDLNDLAAIYAGAIAYVQPSLYEGFGLPVLEAMQCKTPVVCAKNSSLIEVGGGEVVFVNPEAEEIAKGVEQIMSWSKTKREDKIRSAYKWSQTYSWEKVANETAKVYQLIIKHKS